MKGELRNLVWLQTAFIGDVVLTSGAIALASKHFPELRQHLISTSAGCAVLRGSPFLQTRVPFLKRGPGGMLSLWTSFRDVKQALKNANLTYHDTVLVQVHRSLRSSLLARFLGFRTITYDETVGAWMAQVRVRRDRTQHEALRVASLLAPLGVSQSEILGVKVCLDSFPLDGAASWKKDLASFKGKIVAFAVGSQWGTKRWPIESYGRLAELLFQQEALALLLIGSADEKNLTDLLEARLSESFPQRKVWNLAGSTSFDELRSIFPRLSLLVSNDSSPVHFASAFNTPTLAIFGPTVPRFGFGPLAEKSRIAEHAHLSCRPCSDHGPQTCPLKHFRCMKELEPRAVYELACELLEDGEPAHGVFDQDPTHS